MISEVGSVFSYREIRSGKQLKISRLLPGFSQNSLRNYPETKVGLPETTKPPSGPAAEEASNLHISHIGQLLKR